MQSKLIVVILLGLLLIVLLRLPSDKEHREHSEQIINCIVGEASDQGLEGMLYIASAIRNRGTLVGVYGCNAPHIKTENPKTFEIAREVWELSKKKDYAQGATEWRSTRTGEDMAPVKYNNMVFIFEYKDHKFYRLIREKGDSPDVRKNTRKDS